MKKVGLFIIMIIMYHFVFSQTVNFPIDKETGEIVYSEVIELVNKTKDELYLRANEWFVMYFKSSKDAIQFSDKDAGKIIAKGNFDVYYTGLGMTKTVGYISFTIEVAVKEGKYKYKITDFWHHAGTSNVVSPGDLRIEKAGIQITKKAWLSIREQANSKTIELIASIKEAMANANKDKDW